jgi:hypothetical protein
MVDVLAQLPGAFIVVEPAGLSGAFILSGEDSATQQENG